MAENRKRIFVHDYMGGWLDRGIPLFTRNLVAAFQDAGWDVRSVRASSMQRRWPRLVNHLLGAFFEQLVAPILWRLARADAVIYPYNAMPLVDVICRRAYIVIHDTMAFQFEAPFYTRLYYKTIYFFVRRSKRQIFTVSEQEVDRLRSFGFQENKISVIRNSFGIFRRCVRDVRATTGERNWKDNSVLLCTGTAPTKDLPCVFERLLPAVLAGGWEVEIMGLGGGTVQTFREKNGTLQKAKILERLTDKEVAQAYLRNRVIWVHSRQEGFGRCVVEGRLAGRAVVCSDIPEFARLMDRGVYLYKSAEELLLCLQRARTDTIPEHYEGYDDGAALSEALLAFE